MNNDSSRTEPASDTVCKSANFKFACPYCGQPLEAEPDWVGMECECPECGKAITVPQPPQPKPLIKVVGKPERTQTLESSQENGPNPAWWKTVPKWAYGVVGAAMLAIIGLAVALLISVKRVSSDGNRRTEGNTPVTVSNGDKKNEKPAPPPRLDIKPLKQDQKSAEWVKSCEEADWEEVMRFPDKNKDKPFFLNGEIFQIHLPDPAANNHRGGITVKQNGDWERMWIVLYDDERTFLPKGNMLKGDEIAVCGTFEKIFAQGTLQTPRIVARVIANDLRDIAEMFDIDDIDDDDGRQQKTTIPPNKTEQEAEALFQEAMRYYEGDGVLKNVGKAIQLLKEASENGSVDANAKLALFYWTGLPDDGKSVKKAVEYAEKSGPRKTDLAEMVLGNCYLYGGDGVKQDFRKAYSHFSKPTDYNYSKFMRGLMLYHGVGTKEDKEQAAETFFDCCKGMNGGQYCGEAAICLGYMYANGEGIGKDSSEARKWLTWGVKAAGYYVENYRPVYDFLYEKIGLKVGTLDFAKYPADMELVRFGLVCYYSKYYGK